MLCLNYLLYSIKILRRKYYDLHFVDEENSQEWNDLSKVSAAPAISNKWLFDSLTVVRTLGNTFLILSSVGDLKTDEGFSFQGFCVLVVPPGIRCKNTRVCAGVHFAKKADFHQVLEVIHDYKTTESCAPKYLYLGKY